MTEGVANPWITVTFTLEGCRPQCSSCSHDGFQSYTVLWGQRELCVDGATGARKANLEQSVPGPERWASRLLSENKTKRLESDVYRCINSAEVIKLTYIKPTATHDAVNLFIGQLGAVRSQTPGHLIHNFCIAESIVRKTSQSVHLPH